MRKTIFLLFLAGCSSAPGTSQLPVNGQAGAPADGKAASPGTGVETITPADMRARIAFLASDELKGRNTPSPGLEKAAEYIAGEFREWGLQPAGDNGTYIQRYPYVPRPRRGAPAPANPDTAYPPNVVAILPGSDPALRDTYVVFSAHMDHVGVGQPDARGDSIYNGADDDASGTSAVLEVAQAMASLPQAQRPKRSMVFLLVSGEEKGLLGSAWYADHPTVPLEKIVANVNIDMIGRNSPDTVVAIGNEYSSLGPLVAGIAKQRPELGFTVVPDIWPEERFFFRSDHFNFAKKEIPAIFFFAGVHEDYHRPSDEVETIDTDKATRIARLVYFLADAIGNDPNPPKWTPEGLEAVRALTRQGR